MFKRWLLKWTFRRTPLLPVLLLEILAVIKILSKGLQDNQLHYIKTVGQLNCTKNNLTDKQVKHEINYQQ